MKNVFKQHSLLLAWLTLLLIFEVMGRLLSQEVTTAWDLYSSGNGSWPDFVAQLGSSLTATDFSFLTPRNLTNLTLQVSINGVLAVGMTLVILTGGIDLSVGSMVAFCGIVLGIFDTSLAFGNWYTALAAALFAGFILGRANGLLIARLQMAPFVITLGMLVVARGLALILSNSTAISPLSGGVRYFGSGFLPAIIAPVIGLIIIVFAAATNREKGRGLQGWTVAFFRGRIFWLGAAVTTVSYVFTVDRGFPVPFLILATVAALGVLTTNFTVFGRYLYAIGGNEKAAILSGIDVQRVKSWAYTILGVLAGVCGAMLAGRLNSATPTEGQLMELDAIASVVIGGTSLRGGVGTVIGSVIGAFIIGTMNNGMDMLEISSNWQMVAKGLIIIGAVYSDARMSKAVR